MGVDYNRSEESKEVFKSKRKPKNDIKFSIQLNEEQKGAKLKILENQIVIITGNAGTGKTLVAAQTVLDLLFTSEIDKAFITRPTQQLGNSLGYLPGQLEDKLNPYLDPFKDNLYACYNDKEKIDKMLKDSQIEGMAIQFIRGKTYGPRRVLVVDEAQNTTKDEMLAILTRLGKNGRIIVIGDTFQKDISAQLDGLSYAIEMSKKIDGIEWIKMTQNHRSDLVSKILEYEYGK